jgi:hypothetical protein
MTARHGPKRYLDPPDIVLDITCWGHVPRKKKNLYGIIIMDDIQTSRMARYRSGPCLSSSPGVTHAAVQGDGAAARRAANMAAIAAAALASVAGGGGSNAARKANTVTR